MYKNLVPAREENIKKAAEIIKMGGVVAFPTETVYGLGANALNPHAVARIYEIKNRPSFDPLIVHVCSIEMVDRVAERVDEISKRLMGRFWPGPLTIVLPKRETVPSITTAGLETVALRMPANETALKLIEYSSTPIAAPSANPFGYVSPTNALQVAEMLGDRVDLILDGGKTTFGVESTIIMVRDERVFLLRPGALPVEEIEEFLKVRVEVLEGERVLSPGMLPKHYAPKAKVFIMGDWNDYYRLKALYGNVALVLPKRKGYYDLNAIYLSEEGELREIAANLFETLYSLDKKGIKFAVFKGVEERGLGRAIMNRLKKASG
ncbi:MAG: L-threonylcarbamoyladenylate synthase [candidate division WOR-3 bacterium]